MLLDAGFQTLADLKSRLLPDPAEARTEWDDELRTLGKGVAGSFDRFCNRTLARGVAEVYEAPADLTSVALPAFPVEVVTLVELDCGDGSPVDITTDILNLGKPSGILDFGFQLGRYYDRVRVTFTGGFWLDDGGAQPAGSTALPVDVLDAYQLQCQAEVEHSNLFRTAGLRRAERKAAEARLETLGMLPEVVRRLNPYRRIA